MALAERDFDINDFRDFPILGFTAPASSVSEIPQGVTPYRLKELHDIGKQWGTYDGNGYAFNLNGFMVTTYTYELTGMEGLKFCRTKKPRTTAELKSTNVVIELKSGILIWDSSITDSDVITFIYKANKWGFNNHLYKDGYRQLRD